MPKPKPITHHPNRIILTVRVKPKTLYEYSYYTALVRVPRRSSASSIHRGYPYSYGTRGRTWYEYEYPAFILYLVRFCSSKSCNTVSSTSTVQYSYQARGTVRVPYAGLLVAWYRTVQADLMMALVAVIRDLLCEFLSKSLGEKPR